MSSNNNNGDDNDYGVINNDNNTTKITTPVENSILGELQYVKVDQIVELPKDWDDEKSLDFSIDPDMFKKLGFEKAKRRDRQTYFENTAIIDFQVKKDIEKIKTRKHLSQNVKQMKYINKRGNDVNFRNIASIKKLGSLAKFETVSNKAHEESWRTTSTPFGIIAQKRHLEFMIEYDAGPSNEDLIHKEQKTRDEKLWDEIYLDCMNKKPKYGKAVPPIKPKEKKVFSKAAQKRAEEVKLMYENNPYLYNCHQGNFKKNRVLVSKSENKKKLKIWDKYHYKKIFDLKNESFPALSFMTSLETGIRNTQGYSEKEIEGELYGVNIYSSFKYIKNGGNMQIKFEKYKAKVNSIRIQNYLQSKDAEIDLIEKTRIEKKLEGEKQIRMKAEYKEMKKLKQLKFKLLKEEKLKLLRVERQNQKKYDETIKRAEESAKRAEDKLESEDEYFDSDDGNDFSVIDEICRITSEKYNSIKSDISWHLSNLNCIQARKYAKIDTKDENNNDNNKIIFQKHVPYELNKYNATNIKDVLMNKLNVNNNNNNNNENNNNSNNNNNNNNNNNMSLLNIDNPNKTLLSDTTTTTTKPSSEKIMTKRYCDLIKNIELPLRNIDIESNHLDVAALVKLRHVSNLDPAVIEYLPINLIEGAEVGNFNLVIDILTANLYTLKVDTIEMDSGRTALFSVLSTIITKVICIYLIIL
jgi:hypothetical protein